jgi:hypothetical protein
MEALIRRAQKEKHGLALANSPTKVFMMLSALEFDVK